MQQFYVQQLVVLQNLPIYENTSILKMYKLNNKKSEQIPGRLWCKIFFFWYNININSISMNSIFFVIVVLWFKLCVLFNQHLYIQSNDLTSIICIIFNINLSIFNCHMKEIINCFFFFFFLSKHLFLFYSECSIGRKNEKGCQFSGRLQIKWGFQWCIDRLLKLRFWGGNKAICDPSVDLVYLVIWVSWLKTLWVRLQEVVWASEIMYNANNHT